MLDSVTISNVPAYSHAFMLKTIPKQSFTFGIFQQLFFGIFLRALGRVDNWYDDSPAFDVRWASSIGSAFAWQGAEMRQISVKLINNHTHGSITIEIVNLKSITVFFFFRKIFQ